MVLIVNFFDFLKYIFAICDLVSDVEAIIHLNCKQHLQIFSEISVTPIETAICDSRASLIFQKKYPICNLYDITNILEKKFQMLFVANKGNV